MEKILKNTFSLVISNTDITAVELVYQKGSVKVVNYSRVELKPETVSEDCIIANQEEFKNALLKLVIEAVNGPIKSRNVIISIPEEKVFFHYLNVPKDCSEDFEFVRNVANDFIPIELGGAITDYKILPRISTDKTVKLNFVAIQKNIVEPLINILGESGLKVVAVDTSKDALIRFCDNPLNKNEGDFMVVDIAMPKILLCSVNSHGLSHSLNSKISGKNCLDTIKDLLKIASFSDVENVLAEIKKQSNPEQNEKYQSIKNSLQIYYDALMKKSADLIKIMKDENGFKLDRIYVVGRLSYLPGLKEKFKETYPETEVIDKIKYVKLDGDGDIFYHRAIGLALRAALPKANENEINLLPAREKEKLNIKNLTPVIIKPLMLLFGLLAFALIYSGISGISKYMEYKFSEKEKILAAEQIENPYLKEAAKFTEQKTQLERQIAKILGESLPAGPIMQKIDGYNTDSASLITVNFSISNKNEPVIFIRGKTANRKETEEFITLLENDPYYLQVNSPLSNLVGQGERFINLDMTLNTNEILKELFNTVQKNSPKFPEKDNVDND